MQLRKDLPYEVKLTDQMLFSMFIFDVSQILQIERISSAPKRYLNKIIRLLIMGLVETKKVGELR